MNEEMPQPNVITQNEIDEIDRQYKQGPIMLDGVMIGGYEPLGEDEDGVMPSFTTEDGEEDESYLNFTIDGVGYLEEMKAAGLDPMEKIPKNYTPAQWASHKREIQAQYPGWDIVISEDGSSAKVVK
jgi:hypothetical protein